MGGHCYQGESSEDRAFNKLEKTLKDFENDKSRKRRPITLKEQLDALKNRTFLQKYGGKGYWEKCLNEEFQKRYKFDLNSRFNVDRFTRKLRELIQECWEKEMEPSDAAKEIGKYRNWI